MRLRGTRGSNWTRTLPGVSQAQPELCTQLSSRCTLRIRSIAKSVVTGAYERGPRVGYIPASGSRRARSSWPPTACSSRTAPVRSLVSLCGCLCGTDVNPNLMRE